MKEANNDELRSNVMSLFNITNTRILNDLDKLYKIKEKLKDESVRATIFVTDINGLEVVYSDEFSDNENTYEEIRNFIINEYCDDDANSVVMEIEAKR